MADDGNAAKGNTEREAYDLLADGFGPGFNGPFQVVVDLESNTGDDGARRREPPALGRRRGHRGRQRRPMLNEAGDTAVLIANADVVTAGRGNRDRRSNRIRADVLPEAVADTGAVARVTGQTALEEDLSQRISERLRVVHRRRRAAVVPAPDDRVPLGARAAEGRDHEPAVDRCRLRRDRRHVPVGLGQGPARPRGDDPGQPVRPDDHVRHPVRPLHGLRGVPALPGP